MNAIQDSSWVAALALCEAVLSGEASKQVLDAAKSTLSSMTPAARSMVVRESVSRGIPRYNINTLMEKPRPSLKCALADL